MSKGIAGLLLLVLFCGHLSAAEVFRWQDSHGQWHFGGPEVAVQSAEPVVMPSPSFGLDMTLRDTAIIDQSPKGRHKAVGRMLVEPVIVGRKTNRKHQPQKKKESCEHWRERLRKSRLGLRDHEEQSAYEHECILNAHW